ncbi:baseplate wedge subunit and tail pin, partial [Xanthomonas pisi]|uniref:baseplate wedge subunit and tail pin n=1 Tax=Xanthomonas pisi TaxID=56457 RepID=UPI00062D99E5
DYSIEYDGNDATIARALVFDRKFEDQDIIDITWFNNDLGTLLSIDDILDTTDERYVAQGATVNVTGDVALTDFNNIGWPNVEPVPTYSREFSSIANIFNTIYPVGTIYENA